ncbi:MAG TPA: radical SAM protein [Polyangiaceae bacterium]|nr:radical SAM protein [Polyangiaceae bacterium]
MTPEVARAQFRPFALDGARLYFQPATGTHLRVQNAATRDSRRAAPRVVMFGITNACNLDCDYCSRDRGRHSRWTVPNALAALRGLARAGALEVAFGGGEPFAFRGFAELVAELYATTPLALHATSNGALIRPETWPAFAGRLGQVRLSLHDDVTWRGGARVLAEHGQLWGANLIVDDAALPGLPARLAELAALRCHDVSLLRYVGPDPRRHLGAAGRRRLAEILADAPLPCRLSVCFGDRVPAPRLFDGADGGGDCGAGLDFVSITPDQKVQGCSFQDGGLPGATADEVLRAWRLGRARFAQPAWREGCARTHAPPAGDGGPAPPPLALWRAFSGNNSGECVMVATFATVPDAEAYLAELAPGWVADEPYSPAWRELFRAERVVDAEALRRRRDDDDDDRTSPRELVAVARTVMAVAYHSGDAFPELRALAWRRGAHVLAGGVHVHDTMTLLAAVRARDADDAGRLSEAPPHPAARCYRHGDLVLLTVPVLGRAPSLETLPEARDLLLAFAAGRPHAAEIFSEELAEADLLAAKQRLGVARSTTPRLLMAYWEAKGGEKAHDLARLCEADDAKVAVAGGSVLVEGVGRRRRLALLGYRHGAAVAALDAPSLRVSANFWLNQPPRQKGKKAEPLVLDEARLDALLRARLPGGAASTLRRGKSWQGVAVTLDTDEPVAALGAFEATARELGARLWVGAADPEPLASALRRVIAEARK